MDKLPLAMARTRTHDDGCGIAHASDLLGQRWALLVVRELILGPKRFTDLRAGIPDISPNVLGQRLRELEESGIVRRRKLAPPAAVQVYELTEWGMELEPAILSLGRWASASPSFPLGAEMGPDSLVLALKSTFDPAKADGLKATYGLQLGDDIFGVEILRGDFVAWRGEPKAPDAVIRSAPDIVAGIVFGGRSLKAAISSGEVEIEGSRQAATQLIGLLAAS
jgi:DNA-binding HxlR family transcriptional regulator